MLLKVAWRNIWRQKVRSSVVIIAIGLGLWAGLFASAFVRGMMDEKIKSSIQMETSHFQIHHQKFRDEFSAKLFINNFDIILKKLSKENSVIDASDRSIGMYMLGSATKNGAIKIQGINPDKEAVVTQLDKKIRQGKFFEGVKRNPILISEKTANDYDVELKSKVVLTFQDLEGEITSGAFRVVGIYKTDNNMYDGMNAFVRKADITKLLGKENITHEIAVLLNNHDMAEPLAKKYKREFSNLEVLPWQDLSSGMRYMIEAMDTYTIVIVGIILIALLFSIVNTMLMAVLERVKEMGMLMAIGMSKPKIFFMIMLETIFLTMLGAPLGLLLSYASIAYFGNVGINLSAASYSDYGFANFIHPFLPLNEYLDVTIMVIIMAILAAIYPAIKALKLNPVEAIRKI